MKTNCEDCNKEIDDSDVLVEHYHRCDDCIREWLSAKKERIMKSGKCSKCKKIMKSKSKVEIDFVDGVLRNMF